MNRAKEQVLREVYERFQQYGEDAAMINDDEVAEMVVRLNVSEADIRRYFRELKEDGYLTGHPTLRAESGWVFLSPQGRRFVENEGD